MKLIFDDMKIVARYNMEWSLLQDQNLFPNFTP